MAQSRWPVDDLEARVTDTWNPTQYEKFRAEREQPFADLLAMIRPAARMRIVDLGCGTGRLTRRLHRELSAVETLGVDRSPRMLARAREDGEVPGLRFEVAEIERFDAGKPFDLVFSNAAYHWVEDHPALLARLASNVAPGGQLAFQIPAAHEQPSHVVADELARMEPFVSASGGWRRFHSVLTPEEYARLLFKNGFVEQRSVLVVYPHVLESRDAVIEWMKGTLLTEYERHLPKVFGTFVDRYRERLLPQLEDTRPFFFPFPRILCWARKLS
jgi:trans-aconitate 2-methyltransferase